MVVHNALTGIELHETKGAAAALKGQTLVATGVGTALYQAMLTNVVCINVLADLPTAAGGKHTLLPNVTYLFGANIDIGTNYLLFSSNTTIMSLVPLKATITYTGTADMLQGVDVNLGVSGLSFICPNANLFGVSETTGGANIILLEGILIISCLGVGTFDKVGSIILEGMTAIDCASGLAVTGAVTNGFRMTSIALTSTSTSFIGFDFTGATVSTVNMSGIIVAGGAGSIGIKGDAGSANITANFVANVETMQFQGVTTPLSGISLDDVRWNFQSNGGLADSMPDALTAFTGNATATVIATVNTPVLIAGTFVEERASQYSTTAAGRVTLLSERDVVTPIDATISIEPVSGTNKIVSACIALNGTVITESAIATHVDNGDPKVITIPWQLNLSEGDFVEVYVENQTDAVNLLVSHITFRVR